MDENQIYNQVFTKVFAVCATIVIITMPIVFTNMKHHTEPMGFSAIFSAILFSISVPTLITHLYALNITNANISLMTYAVLIAAIINTAFFYTSFLRFVSPQHAN